MKGDKMASDKMTTDNLTTDKMDINKIEKKQRCQPAPRLKNTRPLPMMPMD
jgi:hypothetical protein